MTPSPEAWPTKEKEAPSDHDVKQVPMGLNLEPTFQEGVWGVCVGRGGGQS